MEEDIPSPDLGENIVVVHHRRYRLRLVGRIFQMVKPSIPYIFFMRKVRSSGPSCTSSP